MSKTNDVRHKDVIHGLPLTYQEERVASVKNTKRRRWWTSKINDVRRKDVTHNLSLIFQEEKGASVKHTAPLIW